MSHDIGKSKGQESAEADIQGFKDKLGPFVVAAETTRMPMVFTDARSSSHPIVFANQAFLNLTGYGEHEVLGQSFDFLMERGTDPEALIEIRTAFAGARDLETHVHYRRKDGSMVWVTIFITPVRDKDGEVVQHFASFVDVTRHKEREEYLRLLQEELQHCMEVISTKYQLSGRSLPALTGPLPTAMPRAAFSNRDASKT